VRGLGSCLADDMGLGKTVQALALILKLRESGFSNHPALVVCPTTVVGNWQKEAERFSPSLRVSVYHGLDRRLHTEDRDLVITSYGTLRRDLAKFRERHWGVVVADEAQNIKNPQTDQARAVKALRAEARVALSGTPVENHLGELWSIFDFINPGLLGPRKSFRRRFAVPIERYRDPERLETLRRVTSPFIMRRLKTDKSVIADLPEKIVREEYCYLTPQQAALYQRIVDETLAAIEGSAGMRRRGLILSLITSLKQVCDHPFLYHKRGDAVTRLSGKAVRAMELLSAGLDAGEKALVFTQYVEMGELLVRMIREELGERALFYHGGLPRGKRDSLVVSFQETEADRVMVVSLRAGGTGLNLTAAGCVIHYDLWWNPAVEDQATDRAYRIGRTRDVYVHRLVTLHTFEEKVEEMMRGKRELAELAVSGGERWITELSDGELRDIFALRESG
jgi:SNF2 family DNA or RNA helicase